MHHEPESEARDRPLVGIGGFATKLAIGTAIAVIVAVISLRLIGSSGWMLGDPSPSGARRSPDSAKVSAKQSSVQRDPGPAVRAPVEESGAAATPIAREIERRHDAGELAEAQRRFEACPGGDVRRVAWIDRQQRVVKIVRHRAGGELVEEWFDTEGRLREAVVKTTAAGRPWQRRVVLDERGREARVDTTPGLAPELPPPALVTGDPTGAFFSGPGCQQR